ncbi:hypothetical protein ACFO3O_15570 [Dokdonia ponticola]|uniref:DUF3575 domain-containing protein n=1 Tax=Dokdonia ponticola TaxID=2041041 RepID=A0ABV9I0K9_9FLAO
MKKYMLTPLLLVSIFTNAQDVSVEKSTYGIQTGLLGVWVHNESKLSNSIALRSELGFDAGFWLNDLYDVNGFIMAAVITAEPRWYYNLNKRKNKSRRTDGNSGNFLSLKTSYHPDWFVISNVNNVQIRSDFSIIPTWGIRRNVGKHFTYESGIGIGYQYFFSNQNTTTNSQLTLNLHLRLGYRF